MKKSSARAAVPPGAKKPPSAPQPVNWISALTARVHGAQVLVELTVTERQLKKMFALTGGAGTIKP